MGRQIQGNQIHLSNHAQNRMNERAIDEWQIEQVLNFGRCCFNRKAQIYAVGRKEVKANGKFLRACEGIHVVCSVTDGAVITAYRNQDLRGLRHRWVTIVCRLTLKSLKRGSCST